MDENNERLKEHLATLGERVGELELKLIEQEHRLWPVVHNLTTYFKKPGARRRAAVSAFFWRMLRIGGAGSIGIGALLTLYVGWQNLQEFRRQNNIVQQQTQVLIDQNRFLQRSSNVIELSSLIEDLETKRLESDVPADSAWELPRSFIYRIVAVSKLFEPNVTADGDSTRLISQERGLLLKALVANKVAFPLVPNPDFSNADLHEAMLEEANLNGVNLMQSDLSGANISGADLSWANLTEANLSDADIANTNLRGTYFVRADLKWSSLYNANLSAAHLSGADLTEVDLRDAYLEGVIGLNANQLCKANLLLGTRLDSELTISVCSECPGRFGSGCDGKPKQ